MHTLIGRKSERRIELITRGGTSEKQRDDYIYHKYRIYARYALTSVSRCIWSNTACFDLEIPRDIFAQDDAANVLLLFSTITPFRESKSYLMSDLASDYGHDRENLVTFGIARARLITLRKYGFA